MNQKKWPMRVAGFVVCLGILAIPAAPAQTDELAQKSQQAHELMAAGKFEQAIPIYRELIQAAPENPGLKMDLGMALDRYAEASEHYRKLSELVPQSPGAWAGLGQC